MGGKGRSPSAAPFTCPKCGNQSPEFHDICPLCGRPFVRDYTDTRIHPRDPDLTGICTSRFWARVFLIVIILSIVSGLLFSFGILH